MKRTFTAILAAAMLCLTACGGAASSTTDAVSSSAETSREDSKEDSKAVTERKEESSAAPATTTLPTLDPHAGATVVKAVAGGAFSGALTENGDLYLWGANGRGQCGDGTGEHVTQPKRIMEHFKYFALTKNGSHGGAITDSGDLWCCCRPDIRC